jgi:hypothetical protein
MKENINRGNLIIKELNCSPKERKNIPKVKSGIIPASEILA